MRENIRLSTFGRPRDDSATLLSGLEGSCSCTPWVNHCWWCKWYATDFGSAESWSVLNEVGADDVSFEAVANWRTRGNSQTSTWK